MKKVVRLTESELIKVVKKFIKEDFEDEWPNKDRYEDFPVHLWDKYKVDGGPEKMMSDPEWQKWKRSSDEISKYDKERRTAYQQLEPSSEVKKYQQILGMEPW